MGLSIKNTPILGVPLVCIAWIVAVACAIIVYHNTRDDTDVSSGGADEMGTRAEGSEEGDVGDGGRLRVFRALEMDIDTMFTVYVVMLSVIVVTGMFVLVQFCRGKRGPIPPSIGELDDFLSLRAITTDDVKKSLVRARRHMDTRAPATIDQGYDDGMSSVSSDASGMFGTSFTGGAGGAGGWGGLARIRVNDGSVNAL